MIAKGASRSGPRQLAVYLMRVERYKTGEPVDLLELQSPWAEALNLEEGPGSEWRDSRPRTAAKLIEAFRDWQTLVEGTKQGRDGLYHAELSPEAHYAETMTPEQWKRAADILGEELGLQDQARALVLHGGTDGRKHLHIVWARTDVDAMKVISDSNNYLANERASQRMELEFGQDFVPGKHSKRDRKEQPEFPRQEYNQAEAQQALRTEMTVPERKAQLTALHATANGGQAFKSALEAAGYVLAQGDRGYMVVDEAGEFYSLSRYIKGMKKGRLEEFMAGIELDKLPTIEEAKALQQSAREQTRADREEAAVIAEKPGPEASKFLQPEAPARVEEPAPAQPASKFLPKADAPAPVSPPLAPEAKPFDFELYANYNREPAPPAPVIEPPAPVVAPQQAPEPEPAQPASKFLRERETVQPMPTAEKPAGIDLTLYAPSSTPPKPPAPLAPKTPEPEAPGDDWTRYALKEQFEGLKPPAPAPTLKPKREWEDREIYDLRQATWKRQVREYQEFADQNGREYKQHGVALDNANVWKMEDFDLRQRAALHDMQDRLNPEPKKGFRGVLDAIHRTLNPQDEYAITAAKQEELALFKGGQAQERREYIKVLEENKRIELEKLRERHLAQQAQRERSYNEEIERRVAELKEARRIARELEAEQREKDLKREGPEPPEEGKA